jgi:hypothetical protein
MNGHRAHIWPAKLREGGEVIYTVFWGVGESWAVFLSRSSSSFTISFLGVGGPRASDDNKAVRWVHLTG